MPYIPNATDPTEPVESQTVESAALEFRTLKTSVNARLAALQSELDAEELARANGDAAEAAARIAADNAEIAIRAAADIALQNNINAEAATRAAADSALDLRTTAVEVALTTVGEGGLPGTVYVQRFSGNGVQTNFTLATLPQSNNVVDVYVGGLYQNKDTFTVSGSLLIFSEAPVEGTDNIEVQVTVTIALGTTDAALVGYTPAGIGAVATNVQEKLRRDLKTVADFGAKFDFNGTTGTDDSAAWTSAINWAMANYPQTLVVNDGFSLCNSVWPVINRPVSIVAEGRSYVCFSASATGQCVTVRNTGFNDEVGYMPKTGNTLFTNSADVQAGTELRGFWLVGNRTAASKQHGLVFEGNCDMCRVDLDIVYFNGSGFWAGKQDNNGVRGMLRESTLLNVRTRCCGNADGTASILFEVTDSTQAADSSNLIKDMTLECVFPYGRGIEFKDSRTVDSGSPIYGFGGALMVHGWQNAATNNGALLHFEGAIELMEFDVNVAYNRSATPDIVFTRNAATGRVPRDIRLRVQHPESLVAYDLQYGVNIMLDFLRVFTRKEILNPASTFAGPLQIGCSSNAPFLIYPASIQLSGTTPISLPSWNGAFNGFSGMSSFMPTINTDGTGDTMKAAIDGVVGIITRSGSTTAGTDTYTFTPGPASSNFIPANSYFSKFAVSSSQQSFVSGRYTFSENPQGGLLTSSTWNSRRLLSVGGRRIWAGSNGELRYLFGEPASETDGRVFAVWSKAYVGVSATPSVATRNVLVANYASPTTITNFTSGQDTQVITVVATNGNCTIANNANIVTATGANVTMTTNTSLQFVYSSDAARWIQVQ